MITNMWICKQAHAHAHAHTHTHTHTHKPWPVFILGTFTHKNQRKKANVALTSISSPSIIHTCMNVYIHTRKSVSHPDVSLADHVQVRVFAERREHHHVRTLVPCDCTDSCCAQRLEVDDFRLMCP